MKRHLAGAIQIGLTLVLGWVLLSHIDIGTAWARAAQVPATTALLLLALVFLQIGVVGWRMKLIGKAIGCRCRFHAWLRAVLVGSFVGQTPLTSSGGDLVRVWCVARAGLTLGNAASAVALDRLLGLLSLLLMVFLSALWLWPMVSDRWMRAGIALSSLGVVCGVGLLMTARFLPFSLRKFPPISWVAGVSALLGDILVHRRYGVWTLALGVLVNLLSIAVICILFRALDADVSVGECLILTPFPLLLSLLPFSISGWGVRESSLVAAFSLVKVPADVTLAVSVLFGLILLGASLPGAIFLLGYRRQQKATASIHAVVDPVAQTQESGSVAGG